MKKYILDGIIVMLPVITVPIYKFVSKINNKRRNDEKAQRNGTQALLRNQIISNYNQYKGEKTIPIYARENVLNLYESYHALGGNGAVTDLVEELRKMPSKESL